MLQEERKDEQYRVDDEDVVPGVDGDVAGLHESLLLGAACPEGDERRVVLGHLDEQGAVLDRPGENHDLQGRGREYYT